MPQSHIAYRVDTSLLINEPEQVLQRMSFKIFEKREQILTNLINTKVSFKTSGGIDTGIFVKKIGDSSCQINVEGTVITVAIKKLLL